MKTSFSHESLIPFLNNIQESVKQAGNNAAMIESLIQKLMEETYKNINREGVVECLFFGGTLYREINLLHNYEVLTLMAYHINEKLGLDSPIVDDIMINLCNACMLQKSFEEAYYYGKMAKAKITKPDEELLSNMIITCYALGKEYEGKNYSSELEAVNPIKFATTNEMLKAGGAIQPTKHLDCKKLLNELNSLANNQTRSVQQESQGIRNAIMVLSERPDGEKCWRCWEILTDYFVQSYKNRESEAELIEYMGRVVATGGKTLYSCPDDDLLDSNFHIRYAQSLMEFSFYDRAMHVLNRALLRFSTDPEKLKIIKGLRKVVEGK